MHKSASLSVMVVRLPLRSLRPKKVADFFLITATTRKRERGQTARPRDRETRDTPREEGRGTLGCWATAEGGGDPEVRRAAPPRGEAGGARPQRRTAPLSAVFVSVWGERERREREHNFSIFFSLFSRGLLRADGESTGGVSVQSSREKEEVAAADQGLGGSGLCPARR